MSKPNTPSKKAKSVAVSSTKSKPVTPLPVPLRPVKQNVPRQVSEREAVLPPPIGNNSKLDLDAAQKLVTSDLYYRTLSEPGKFLGVKVPLGATTGTSTITIVSRFQLTANSNGIAGAIIGYGGDGTTIYGGHLPGSTAYNYGGTSCNNAFGMVTCPLATTSKLFDSTAAVGTGSLPIRYAGTTTPWTYFEQCRLVSAEFSVFSTAAPLNNSGEYIAALIDPGFFAANCGSQISNLTSAILSSAPISALYPVGATPGTACHVVWRPIDLTTNAMKYPFTTSQKLQDWNSYEGNFMVIVATGLASGTVLQGSVVHNFEGVVPAGSPYFGSSSASVDDPIASAEVLNAISTVMPIGPGLGSAFAVLSEVRNSASANSFNSDVHARLRALSDGTASGISPYHDGCYQILVQSSKLGSFKSIIKKVTSDQNVSMFMKLAKMAMPVVKKVAPTLIGAL